MRIQIHQLELVYPPISNQEAEWLKDDPEVQADLKKSNLYFIGQKPETIFEFPDDLSEKVNNDRKIYFNYCTGDKKLPVIIDIDKLLEFYSLNKEEIELDFEFGPKHIRIWEYQTENLIEWFTTEKLFYDKWRGKEFIIVSDSFREHTVYNLHYIGISKSNDSLERLIVKPHDKRLRILSNEHPLSIGSRVTDEMILFFFKIDSIEIKQHDANSDFSDAGMNELDDYIRIIIDAEKAFVKILSTEYNQVKFQNYPFSIDGLFPSLVERYSYSINEDVIFLTEDNYILGERGNSFAYSDADFISIDKKNEEVKLFRVQSKEQSEK